MLHQDPGTLVDLHHLDDFMCGETANMQDATDFRMQCSYQIIDQRDWGWGIEWDRTQRSKQE